MSGESREGSHAAASKTSGGVLASRSVGHSWILTGVTSDGVTTTISAEVGAKIEFLNDGRISMYDSVNSVQGRFIASGEGFDVSDVSQTLVGYGGDDAQRLAAIAGIRALAHGIPHAPATAVSNSVLVVDDTNLTVGAGSLRLTFARA